MGSDHPLYQPLDPVNGEDISRRIASRIEAVILKGELKPGERLPAERELQQRFQTGRGVIREALRELKQKGLLETRHGGRGGTFVKEVNAAEASEPLALLIRQQEIPVGFLVEFRECIDRSITVLAIARGTQQELDDLVSGTRRLEKTAMRPSPSMKRIGRIDQELNLLLARMTRNPMFEYIMRTIQIGFGSYDHILYESVYYREKTVKNWQHTARSIAERQPMQALSYIGYHYVLLNRCIAEQEETAESGAKPTEKGDPK